MAYLNHQCESLRGIIPAAFHPPLAEGDFPAGKLKPGRLRQLRSKSKYTEIATAKKFPSQVKKNVKTF